MSLLRPITNSIRMSTKPTDAGPFHDLERDPPAADLLGQRPEHVAAVERQEREQVDHRRATARSARACRAPRWCRRRTLLGDREAADDAVDLLADLGLEQPRRSRDTVWRGDVPHLVDARARRRRIRRRRPRGSASNPKPSRVRLPRRRSGGGSRRSAAGRPGDDGQLRRRGRRQPGGRARRSGGSRSAAVDLLDRKRRCGRRRRRSGPRLQVRAAGGPARRPSRRRPALAGRRHPLLAKTAQRITNAISRLTAGPARITTIRFHTGWL